jgi:hypothetical protein
MRNSLTKVIRFSALVAAGGALSFAVFFSNCGGSSGGRTGTAGTMASGGTSGGGTTGSGGSGGTGGAVVMNMCTPKPDLTCGASAIHLTDGKVTDFGPADWSQSNGKWCDASGLRGSYFPYSGGPDGMSTSVAAVDAESLKLTMTAGSAGYAGGGISFDGCVDVSTYNALTFKAWISGGDITGCNFKSQMQTFEQRPTTQNPPGGCDPDAGSCYGFPASMNLALTTSSQTFTIPFSMFTAGAAHVNPIPGQIVGLQWQLESGMPVGEGGTQPLCTVEIRVDDIAFVTQ